MLTHGNVYGIPQAVLFPREMLIMIIAILMEKL